MKKLISLILLPAILLSLLSTGVFSLGTLTGEASRTVETIKLSDGTDTGVTQTTINLSGYYGDNKIVNITEADLSDTRLSLDVFNCGTYTVSKTSVLSAVNNKVNKEGKTVLSAINGDLWMVSSYGNAKKTLSVSRGPVIIDGEIWATQEIEAEAGIVGLKETFGVTDTNQPLVGELDFDVSYKNGTQTVECDGINRLPANNSLIVYNNRCNSNNYALDEAYEVELTTSDNAFSLNKTVSATVKAIYPQNSATRPSIGASTVLLSARGTAISKISGLKVGDNLTFSVSVTDRYNNTSMWYRVTDAISGHMCVRNQGEDVGSVSGTNEYPTTFIGFNDSGKVMFTTVTANTDGVYKGLVITKAVQFCRELGYNSVFYLDGGGSTTMYTLKDGTYTLRNKCSDGSVRSVINGVAICFNDTPVCESQGSLGYIKVPVDVSEESPAFIDGGLLSSVYSYTNCCSVSRKTPKIASIDYSKSTNDGYVGVDYTKFAAYEASECKSICVKIKADADMLLGIFYGAGSYTYAAPDRYASATVKGDGTWKTVEISMVGKTNWSGKLNFLRIDFFDGAGYQPLDTHVEIEYIALCKGVADSKSVMSGGFPAGSMGYYYEYIHEKNNSHTYDVIEGNPPTCTAGGTADGAYCSGCGKVFYECTPLEALGHDFVKGVCTRCGEADPDYVPDLTGDVDMDGKVNVTDVNVLMRIVLGLDYQTENSDINGDTKVNTTDINELKKIILGK